MKSDALPVDVERLLSKPAREKDSIDHEARAGFWCPICDARPGMTCAWSQLLCLPSWLSHPSRRALVIHPVRRWV